MKILLQFRILCWWRWLRAVNKLIERYLKSEYSVSNCPLCLVSKQDNCSDCLWVRFEGKGCVGELEPDYKQRIKRLQKWKYRMYWGKKAYIKKYKGGAK